MTQQFYFWVFIQEIPNTNLKRYKHPVFIAALFTIANIWKPPEYPSIDNWIRKMWYTYKMDYSRDILPLQKYRCT